MAAICGSVGPAAYAEVAAKAKARNPPTAACLILIVELLRWEMRAIPDIAL
jgi:hypothetical protein